VVRVATTNVPLFSAAVIAIGNLDMNGNNINTDSFDSSNSSLSYNGRFDPLRVTTNGDIASVSGVIDVGNANINGNVLLGSGASLPVVGSKGGVTGTTIYDFNPDFIDVVLPTTTWVQAYSLALPLSINGLIYDYYFATSGDYQIDGSLGGSIYVAPGANVRLKVMNNFSPSIIRVGAAAGLSGKLEIYMTGASFNLSGQALVDGGTAPNLTYFGLPSNTSISISGNASFIGTIYAPEAAITLSGGGSNGTDFIGSLIGKSVTLNGHFKFHFDQALLATSSRGYIAVSWREL